MPEKITGSALLERHYATIVDAMGTDHFGLTVQDVASRLGMHDIFGFLIKDDWQPNPVVATSDDRANHYSRHYSSVDPILKSLRRLSPSAPMSVYRVRVTDIKNAAYRRDWVETGLGDEKLCFVLPRHGNWSILNFYRVFGRDEPEIETCRLLAEILIPLMTKHASIMMHLARQSPVARVEHLLREHFPILSHREAAVCARTAVGKTAQEISDELCIAKSSVLTYRRRAYLRLNVSSASQLLNRFDA